MKIKDIILEYNLQNLLSLFQEKYKEVQIDDESNNFETLDQFIKSIENPLKQQNKFQFVEPYMKWIVQRYVTGKLKKYEDVMSKVVPGLLKYDALKRKNKLKKEHKDINQVKDLNHLLDVLEYYKEEETLSGKEKEKEIEENFYRTREAILLHNDPEFKIVVPKSERASCFFGRNTRWCTAATQGKNFFNEYDKKGNLYIIIVKKENRRFQFHFESNQFRDEKDEPIKIYNDLIKEYPRISDIFSKIIKKNNIKTSYFKNPLEMTLDDLKFLMKKNEISYIFYILNKNKKLLTKDFLYNYLIQITEPKNLLEILDLGNFSDDVIVDILKKDKYIFHKFFEYTNNKYNHLYNNETIYEDLDTTDFFKLLYNNNYIFQNINLKLVKEKIKLLKEKNKNTIKFFFNDFFNKIHELIKSRKGKEIIDIVFSFMIENIMNRVFDITLFNQNLFLESLVLLKKNSDTKKIVDFIFVKKPEILEKLEGYVFKNYYNLIIEHFLDYKDTLKNKDILISFLMGNFPKSVISGIDSIDFLDFLQHAYLERIISENEIIKLLNHYLKQNKKSIEFFDKLLFSNDFYHIIKLVFNENILFNLINYLNNKNILNKISYKSIEKFINFFRQKNPDLFDKLEKNMNNIKEKYPHLF